MDYNAPMNYEELSGKSVLLLGKTRSLNQQEFETLLKLHRIMLEKSYTPEVELVVEGRLMNPLEQAESARIYEEGKAPIVEIDPLEEWLCRSIEPNRLLMSLKLSKDQERLKDFIQNPYITDELFFKLLKLYDWQGEGLFDNDANRDVTAAIIGRFYEDLDRNHNVQYAMSGLAHLIERYGRGELIAAIAELSPIARELKSPGERSLAGVMDAMALHPDTPEAVIKQLLASKAPLLAQRVPLTFEKELLTLNDERVNLLLAANETLSEEGATFLTAEYSASIAEHRPLDEGWFEIFFPLCPASLAANGSLSAEMQVRLIGIGDETVLRVLASNPSLQRSLLEKLYEEGKYAPFLASNPSLDPAWLESLSHTDDPAVLEALASNPSTPIDVLYQLSLDRRFERYVKVNPSYGRHIQTHNIGWH